MKTDIIGLTNTFLAMYSPNKRFNTEYVESFCRKLMKTISRTTQFDMPSIKVTNTGESTFLWKADDTRSYVMEFNLNFTHCNFYDTIKLERHQYDLTNKHDWINFKRKLTSIKAAE
jgi:hypothetical protein